MEDAQIADLLVELLIGYKIRPVHSFNGLKGAGLKPMDAASRGLAEKPYLSAV